MTNRIEILKGNVYPMKVHTWTIEKKGRFIVATSTSKASGKDVYSFIEEPGSLFLYNGSSSKYAYFRQKSFQEWMDRNKLRKIVKESPNREFHLRNYISGNNKIVERLETDGEAEQTFYGNNNFGYPEGHYLVGNACCDQDEIISVTKASYTIIRDLTDGWGVLYSHKPMKLLRKKIDNSREKREAEAEVE